MELRTKQQEQEGQEGQQQMMKAMILQHQQMNTAFWNVVGKLLNKRSAIKVFLCKHVVG